MMTCFVSLSRALHQQATPSEDLCTAFSVGKLSCTEFPWFLGPFFHSKVFTTYFTTQKQMVISKEEWPFAEISLV
jgi:hypothetical protein